MSIISGLTGLVTRVTESNNDKPSRSSLERVSDLRMKHKQIDALHKEQIAHLEAAIGQANTRAEREHREADVHERDATTALVHELLQDTHAALAPLIAAWRAEPTRSCADEIGRQVEGHMAREQVECPHGNCTSRVLIAVAHALLELIANDRPDVLNAFTQGNGANAEVQALNDSLGSPSGWYAAIEALEVAIEHFVRGAPHRVLDSQERASALARWKLFRYHDVEALDTLDRASATQAQKLFETTYRAPPRIQA